MATQRVPIFGHATRPDTSGNVYQTPLDAVATNDRWDHLVWVFADTATKDSLFGTFHVPQSYTDTANLVIEWTANATSNDVEWDFAYRAVGGNDTESLDQSGDQQAVNSNDTAPSAAFERLELSIALTDGNFAAGDIVQFELSRDGVDAGDTMAADALLFGAYFEYADA